MGSRSLQYFSLKGPPTLITVALPTLDGVAVQFTADAVAANSNVVGSRVPYSQSILVNGRQGISASIYLGFAHCPSHEDEDIAPQDRKIRTARPDATASRRSLHASAVKWPLNASGCICKHWSIWTIMLREIRGDQNSSHIEPRAFSSLCVCLAHFMVVFCAATQRPEMKTRRASQPG